jgi:predicted alpha/beta superfamily hydrolase
MRMLSGNSAGGLFALYALFHDLDFFHKYFIGIPFIQYNDGITFGYEANYAGAHAINERHASFEEL